jgi:2-C-methyl-D-erythritol 4-phosphate cytidylyltransferase/2-C-methyl-D-erythritol 2,4-cyclodiphosphate synthase
MRVTAIIAAAGAGRRLGGHVPKQFLDIDGRSLVERSVAAFDAHPAVHDLIVVVPRGFVEDGGVPLPRPRKPLQVVEGGDRRQDSVANAVARVPETTEVVLVHDAARPFVSPAVISRTIEAAAAHGAAIAAVPAVDTVKRVRHTSGGRVIEETIPRESVYLAQTPQAFRRDVIRQVVDLARGGAEATDEAALAERAGLPVHVVEGDRDNVKITTTEDLAAARRDRRGSRDVRIGTGYDLHRLVEGRRLVLGGVEVPSERGALGHSDADAVCHAATDAILGAAALGDIGRHFPDTDPAWKGASSIELLRRAAEMVRQAGYVVVNLDVVVVLEQPKIAPFVERIREGVAAALDIPIGVVSVKGKTNEGVDAVGRGEAIATHAVALLAAS